MFRVLVIPLALLVMLLGAMVWSGGGGTEKRADFSFINRGDIYTLDLNQMSYMQDFRVTYGIREGLYVPAGETLRPTPAGATGYDLSADKKVWTFHLRKASRWSNGDPVTSHDYAFSWRNLLEDPGQYTYLLFYVKGAKAYSETLQAYFAYPGKKERYDKDPAAYAKGVKEAYEKDNPKVPGGDAKAWEAERDKAVAEEVPPRAVVKPDSKDVGIETPDDYTLKVTLIDPVPYMLELVAFPPFYPRNERSMEPFKFVKNEKTGEYTYNAGYTRPPGVVTNGPFVFKRWDFKRRLIFEKSPNYWDRDHVRLNSVEMVVTDNPLSQFLMYESGQVDWNSDVDGDLAAELRIKGRTDLKSSPAFGTAFLTYLCTPTLPPSVAKPGADKNPLADVRVRQALTMAIDKKFIVDSITRMGEMPARTYVPPDGTLDRFTWLAGPYDKTQGRRYSDKEMRKLLNSPTGQTGDGPGIPYNVRRARELLAEAGYPDGKGFPQIPILYGTNSETRKKICQVLKNQWKEQLNINVDLQGLEGKSFRDRVDGKDYAIAPVAWYGDYPDISTFTDKYLSTSKQNDSAWYNKAYDDLCDRASKEGDFDKRLRLLEQAENLLNTEVPIAPLYHYVNVSLNRPYVHGADPNLRSVTVFKDVWVERVMLKLVAFRVLQFPLILAVIYLLTFLLAWVAPGNPFSNEGRKADPIVLDSLKRKFHAESAWSFLTYYPWNAVTHGDFGPSMGHPEWPVTEIIRSALPISVTLGLFAMLIAVPVGVGLGTMAAVNRGGGLDWSSLVLALIGISVPGFVVAAVLLMFASATRWFPIGGWGSWRDLVLPGLALSLAPMAYIVRLTRVSMLDTLGADYVRTARAKGLSRPIIIWKHCLRNAFLPTLTYLGPATALTMTGSFVIEKVFHVPGLGQHFVDSVTSRDRTLILGVVMVESTLLLAFNLLVDVAYGWFDPRIDITARAA